MHTRNKRRRVDGSVPSQRGIGMIEILIAVVLVSFGFLAGARMQVEGMRFSQSAYYRSQAYFMATDIIDRMRANVAGVKSGAYQGARTEAGLSRPDCSLIDCNTDDIAQRDIAEWSDYLHPSTGAAPALPSSPTVEATGTILSQGGGQYTVRLVWADGDDSDTLEVNFLSED